MHMAMPWRLDECFHRQSGVHMQCLVVEKKSLQVLPLLLLFRHPSSLIGLPSKQSTPFLLLLYCSIP